MSEKQTLIGSEALRRLHDSQVRHAALPSQIKADPDFFRSAFIPPLPWRGIHPDGSPFRDIQLRSCIETPLARERFERLCEFMKLSTRRG
jgi:hypothetical protein